MSDLIKKIKIKKQDGTYTDYIPIGAEAKNVDCSDGESVEYKLNKKPYYYNNVADMKADTNLKVGDMAVTLGYYEPNDGGRGEYRIINGEYIEDGGNYHKLNNNLYAELIIEDKINVKQFGAYGDGIHDDTNKIQLALNANQSVCIPPGLFYITNTLSYLGQTSGKTDVRLECKGTIIFNHNFKGDKLFNISNIGHQTLYCDGFSFIHQDFLDVSRATPQETEWTSFEGVVIDNAHRIQVNRLTVVGIANRALVVNGQYEVKITNADIWGGNLTQGHWYNTNVPQNLDPGMNSFYTTGIVLHGNDNILDNIVVVGYSIGLDIHHGGNMITNYHVWKFRIPLIYGIVARGGNNLLTNLYLDSIESNEYRTGAGIYELKTTDITSQEPFYISSNEYANIFATIPDSTAVVAEMGDPNNITLSENCGIINLVTGYNRINYRLYGGAIGNPNLVNSGFRNKGSQYIPFSQLKYDNTKTNITDILKSIIIEYFGTHYGYTNEICFVTSQFNSYFTNGFQNNQSTLVYKIESFSESILKCTIQGYGYRTSEEAVYMFYRGANQIDSYYYNNSHTRIVGGLPDPMIGYLKGSCAIYNNKPYWVSDSFEWLDANGNPPSN